MIGRATDAINEQINRELYLHLYLSMAAYCEQNQPFRQWDARRRRMSGATR
jgi:ferritin